MPDYLHVWNYWHNKLQLWTPGQSITAWFYCTHTYIINHTLENWPFRKLAILLSAQKCDYTARYCAFDVYIFNDTLNLYIYIHVYILTINVSATLHFFYIMNYANMEIVNKLSFVLILHCTIQQIKTEQIFWDKPYTLECDFLYCTWSCFDRIAIKSQSQINKIWK